MRTEPLYRSAERWGNEIQLIMCVEEMSELTKEISKYFRGQDNIQEITEEMGDVYITLEQLKVVFNIPAKKISDIIEEKIKRLEKRLEE